jgi:cob(I)alamin adenosyltransferase
MGEAHARKPRVSTRTGDQGYTGLLGPDRVTKDDPRIEALGDLDEATSAIGLARSRSSAWLTETLRSLQVGLYVVMAEVAAGAGSATILTRRIGEEDVFQLDQSLGELRERARLKPEFVLPGDSPLGATLDVARAVSRRAERRVASLAHSGLIGNEHALAYLNRLSDVLFVAARIADRESAEADQSAPEARSGQSRP